MDQISIGKVVALAIADAVNPCEFAVLTMILISIIAYNPNKRRDVIWGGLAFGSAVFIMYMIYGVFIIKSFQMMGTITAVRPFLYKGLGGLALILGSLQIKDFFSYEEGQLTTEMPMSWRPKLKRLIGKVTSPLGAFGIGLFVTVFLLPCTIGPYIILGGMLSVMDIIKTLPMLVLHNLIFVAPIFIITGIVYLGFSQVEDVQDWKDKNIRILHLIAGLIIFGIGVAMLAGLV